MKLQTQVYKGLELVDITSLKKYQYKTEGRMNVLCAPLFLFINGKRTKIPAGFLFSASIPKPFQWLIGKPTDEGYALAACVHDYLHKLRHNRDETDEAFNILLIRAKVNTVIRKLMYAAVRVGGHMFYAASADNNRLSTRMWRLALNFFYGSK